MSRGIGKCASSLSTQLHEPLRHVQVSVLPYEQLRPSPEQLEAAAADDGQSVSPQPAKLPAPMASTDASSIRVIIRMHRR